MAALIDDIQIQCQWIIKAFSEDKIELDYTLQSFVKIDNFFKENSDAGKPVTGGRLSTNLGLILFSLGSYIGQTIIKNIKGSTWQTNNNDPDGEIIASVKLPDGTLIFPMQRVMNRFQNGDEDSLYVYGYLITKDHFKQSKRAWWKF